MDLGIGIQRAYMAYAAAYERIYKQETEYTERQCGECPYEHHCCSMLVYITPFEAAPILSFINDHAPQFVNLWKKRIRDRAREVRSHMARYNDASEGMAAWHAKGKKCVFYDHRGRMCSIYPVRPLACRRLYSLSDCGKDLWNTALDTMPVQRQRIELLPFWDRYEDNIRELCNTLRAMTGDKPIRMGHRLQIMLMGPADWDDWDYVNPEEKPKNEKTA